jgi:hypothetical protein
MAAISASAVGSIERLALTPGRLDPQLNQIRVTATLEC